MSFAGEMLDRSTYSNRIAVDGMCNSGHFLGPDSSTGWGLVAVVVLVRSIMEQTHRRLLQGSIQSHFDHTSAPVDAS